MLRRANQKGQGTGGTNVRPGDYALGSPQSRAAVRALLERRLHGFSDLRDGALGGIVGAMLD